MPGGVADPVILKQGRAPALGIPFGCRAIKGLQSLQSNGEFEVKEGRRCS